MTRIYLEVAILKPKENICWLDEVKDQLSFLICLIKNFITVLYTVLETYQILNSKPLSIDLYENIFTVLDTVLNTIKK